MKIVCIPGGIPLDFTIQFANSLSKTEEVMIIITDNIPHKAHIVNINENVNLQIIKNVRLSYFHPSNLFNAINAFKIIKNFKPDIIHVQQGDILTVFISVFMRKCVLITTFHDVRLHIGWEKKYIFRFIQFYFAKKSRKIFVHGKKSKDILIDTYNVPKDKVINIPMGEHNVTPFKKYIKKNIKEEKTILFFGWISPRKGLEYLIKAVSLVSREIKDLKIIIAGRTHEIGSESEAYFRNCLNLIDNDNKDSYEIYNKYISWEFGAKLFQRCSIVVLPYLEISQSGVVPVAYSFKKPVVVTDVGSLSEIVEDGTTGIVIPPRNTKVLAEAIITLLKDDNLRKFMGKNAYKKLKMDMSWDKIIKEIIRVYNLVLEK